MPGQATIVGPLGALSSGDLAFNGAGQPYGTVRPTIFASDSLARVDPATGKATVIGGTGKTDVLALKFQSKRETGLSFTGLQWQLSSEA